MALKGNKLLNLKKWITLEQAASALSIQFSEEVSIADMYQLALEEQIKVSINLYNHANVKFAQKKSIDDATLIFSIHCLFLSAPFLRLSKSESDKLSYSDIVRMILDDNDGNPSKAIQERIAEDNSIPSEIKSYFYSSSEQERDHLASAIASSPDCDFGATFVGCLLPNETEILEIESEVQSIDGIWDLPMIGAERLDILHSLQHCELGGEEVTLVNLEGTFLENPETGKIVQLQENFADNEYCSKKDRKHYKKNPSYYPGGLPSGYKLVIRTPEFQSFIASLSDEPRANRKSENFQLRLIYQFATAIHGTLPDKITEKTTKKIIQTVKDEYGVTLETNARTLANYLNSID